MIDDNAARTAWYRRRLCGEIQGPLERYRDNWARLCGENGGWPSGAVASASADCRTAQPDAVIGSAGELIGPPTVVVPDGRRERDALLRNTIR